RCGSSARGCPAWSDGPRHVQRESVETGACRGRFQVSGHAAAADNIRDAQPAAPGLPRLIARGSRQDSGRAGSQRLLGKEISDRADHPAGASGIEFEVIAALTPPDPGLDLPRFLKNAIPTFPGGPPLRKG